MNEKKCLTSAEAKAKVRERQQLPKYKARRQQLWQSLKGKLARKKERLKYKYKITLNKYNRILSDQDNRCAICQEELIKSCLDHCHKTNKVRGILCQHCNSGLGYFNV